MAFFREQLDILHRCSKEGYSALQMGCQRVVSAIEGKYCGGFHNLADYKKLSLLEKDTYSMTIMPSESDIEQPLIPLKCSGDGNCLFR